MDWGWCLRLHVCKGGGGSSLRAAVLLAIAERNCLEDLPLGLCIDTYYQRPRLSFCILGNRCALPPITKGPASCITGCRSLSAKSS